MKKAELEVRVAEVDGARLSHDLEWAVAKRLLEFGDIVTRAGDSCEPHLIAHYLLTLSADFARWYTAGNGDAQLRVLVEHDPALRHARVALVAAVKQTLAIGLALCGIPHPDQM